MPDDAEHSNTDPDELLLEPSALDEAAEEESGSPDASAGEEREDSSEEDEEGENEYDLTDKFIAGEDEDDDDSPFEGQQNRRRRHKRRRLKTPELDEDDYQLLEDNQVTGVRRRQASVRKRIRKHQELTNKTNAQRLEEELFGAAEGGPLDDEDDHPEHNETMQEEDPGLGESDDEMAGFIDDDDVGARQGRARSRGRPKDLSSHGTQEMQDIFGDVDDLLGMYAEKKATALLDETPTNDTGILSSPAAAEAMAAATGQRVLDRSRGRRNKLEGMIEPELMERLMIQPSDDQIRRRDAPERFQTSAECDLQDVFSDAQLDEAARWILDQLLGPMPLDTPRGGETGTALSGRQHDRARAALEGGILEVDGKPRDGRSRRHMSVWDRDELEEGLTDLSKGHRGLRRKRQEPARLAWQRDPTSRQALVASVRAVIEEMWRQQHEIPVIACFRKQLCGELLSLRSSDRPSWTSEREVRQRRTEGDSNFLPGVVQAKHRRLRRWDILWAVHDLSAKWRALLRRKERRLEAFRLAASRCQGHEHQVNNGSVREQDEIGAAVQGCIAQMREANSTEEIDDIDMKYKLVTTGHTVIDSPDTSSLGGRRPLRSSAYGILKKAGLGAVVKAMAMSAPNFGVNLQHLLKRNQAQDLRVVPLDLAFEHVVEGDLSLDGPEKVLERARQIHVAEIISEPAVRAFVREKLMRHMLISTAPTQLGETQLDAFHLFGQVKRLRLMPASAFSGTDDYLRINVAEREGLITVINEVKELEQLFVRPMLAFYESSAVSAVAKEWNNQRHMILREAVQRLVPQLQQEANTRLLAEARAVVLDDYADRLWQYAAVAPVQMHSEDGDLIQRRRVAACCWGEGRPATCMVMLDEQGSLIDLLYLPSFSGQLRTARPGVEYDIARDGRKAEDVSRIVEFCRDNRPQVIFVGARNQFCRALNDDMGRISDFILDAHAQILTSGHDTGTIEVCCAEETLADLWAGSLAAKEEFPDHPDVVRRAVALGRLALEPLAVLAALCGPIGREILSLNLHPLQSNIPDTELLKAAEVVLMTVVAQVGADINLQAANPWQASTLPLVAGLGPRKAQSLLQAVQAREFAVNRISLWNDIWKPGNAVFRNCGAFLKITARAPALVNAEIEAIDSARIEPLSYKVAFEVARTAVGGDNRSREDELANINRAMEYPEKVEATNLEELHSRLAAESANPDSYNQISTLVDIAMEFIQPGMELRKASILEMAREREVQFWWMYGETAETLKPGRRVEAVIRFVGQTEARCILPEVGGLDAVLSANDISTSGPVTPSDYLQAGQSVAARIKTIKPEEFCVEVTTASTDLNDDLRWEEKYCRDRNSYFHVLTPEERRASEAEKRRQARNKVLTKRTIDHPNFRNISMNDAVKLLGDAEAGEAVFRPSLKGLNTICLTIKLYAGPEDVVVHKDVSEGRKRGGQLTLGTPLTLMVDGVKAEEKFEDLDEILARFVDPLVAVVQTIVRHRKFRDGAWEEIRDDLQREASEMRGSAIYCLCIDHMRPGFFYIGSVLPTANKTPRREYFVASPNGIYFRQKVHTSLEKMLAAFKRNPMGPGRQPLLHSTKPMPPALQALQGNTLQGPNPMQPSAPHAGYYGGLEPQTFNPQLRGRS